MFHRRVFPLFSLLFATLLCTTVLANKALPNVPEPEPRDFPEPEPPKEVEAPVKAPQSANLVVKRDARGQTRIIIPAKLVAGTKAAAKARPSSRDTSLFAPARNVVAGLALSAAIAGAFLFVRRGGSKTKAAALFLVGAGVTAAVSTALADIALPRELEPPQILVEIDENAEVVTLIQGKDFPAVEGRRRLGLGEGSAAPQ